MALENARYDLRKWNLVFGWLIFLIAAWTYITTIEPTASFWDAGEFLATANKLQVGHPPGAPFYMILARIASAFVSPANVPIAINILSALASAFTILFLFWSITHMAMKLATKDGREMTAGSMIAVMGSGIVGSLAYTWSDSFWFSAVEAEVYSMSSLFTAVTFWCILKWESEDRGSQNNRWLILICYLLGLGIGVQLLALLCIPAISMVYYFRNYKVTTKGVIYAMVVSALVLGTIQSVIIPGVAKVAGWFELLFVNDFGLPFNTGNIVYAILLVGGLVYLIMWTQRTGKVLWNTVILGVAVILLGYSTYAMIVIRSTANPPIDENNPENVFNLLSYLNREQYGDRPLLIGQFWDSPTTDERKDGTPVYTATWQVKKNGRKVRDFYDQWSAAHFMEEQPGHEMDHAYVITDPRKGVEPVYDPQFTMFFPRMYSNQRSHIDAYKDWSEFKGVPIRGTDRQGKPAVIYKPTFGENITFFANYQVNWMYWRYFLWNFAGRQNDIQGHGNITDGNWITGFKAIDSERLGNQEMLPPSMAQNKGFNRFFLLPLLLGVIGLVYQLIRHTRDWLVVMLLFFFTGLAIVIYLNQHPFQPRERDYAYVGSFYAFAIWIGLGVFALYDAARTIDRKDILYAIGGVLALGIVKYALESIDEAPDHSISLMLLYMGGIGGAALLLFNTLGRSVRNDVVVASMATIVCLSAPVVMVAEGWDDHDRSHRTPGRDVAHNYLESCAPNAILFTNGDNDTFPLWYAQEVEGIRTDVRVVNLSLLNTDWYVDQMRRQAYESEPLPIKMAPEKYRQGTRDVVALIPQGNKEQYRDVREMIAFVTNDKNLQPLFARDGRDAYFPTKRFSLPADSAAVFGSGTLAVGDTGWRKSVEWQVDRQYMLKNHLMLLDLLANFNWQRPIYFAVTTGPDSYLNLQDYFQLEGLTYRLVPVYTPNPNPNENGRVATDIMYENVMNDFLWGNMDSEKPVYLDENILRMTTNLRLQLSSLADQLIKEDRKDDAKKVLDLSIEKMPERNVPYDRIMVPTIEAYFKIGDVEMGNKLSERLFEIMEENFTWYMSLEPEFLQKVDNDVAIAHAVMARLQDVTSKNDPELGARLEERFKQIEEAYELKMQELENDQRRISRMRF
jgi:hypothetical protein